TPAPAVFRDPNHHLNRPIDGCNEVDLRYFAESGDGVRLRLAGFPIHANSQGVTGDACGWNTDTYNSVPSSYLVIDLRTKSVIGGVADLDLGQRSADRTID